MHYYRSVIKDSLIKKVTIWARKKVETQSWLYYLWIASRIELLELGKNMGYKIEFVKKEDYDDHYKTAMDSLVVSKDEKL